MSGLLPLVFLISQVGAVWPSTARADVYQVVPIPQAPLVPEELAEGRPARERVITLDGARVRARSWQAHAAMPTIRAAVRRTVVAEYAAWQMAKQEDPNFDVKGNVYWALPRVVLNPTWLAVVRFYSDGSGKSVLFGDRALPVAPIQVSRVALILPTADPGGAFVWELEMPTRAALSLLSVKATGDAPGRDHEKAGRPSQSTRTFSLEETSGGVRYFTASYATATPTAALDAVAANLMRKGFRTTLRSQQPDTTRIELRDQTTELTLFAASAAKTGGKQGEVVISATDSGTDQ